MNLGTKEEYVSKFGDNRKEEAERNWEHLSKATKDKDVSIIPKGDYCYVFLKKGKNKYGIPKSKYCPYMSGREYNGVVVSYCEYLEWGDLGGITDEEYAKVLEYFGSEEKMNEILPLFFLWDSCKECGENYYTEEEWDIKSGELCLNQEK